MSEKTIEQVLSDLKSNEERISSWNAILPELFDLERSLLEEVVKIKKNFSLLSGEQMDSNMVSIIKEKTLEVQEKIEKHTNVLKSLINRLELPIKTLDDMILKYDYETQIHRLYHDELKKKREFMDTYVEKLYTEALSKDFSQSQLNAFLLEQTGHKISIHMFLKPIVTHAEYEKRKLIDEIFDSWNNTDLMYECIRKLKMKFRNYFLDVNKVTNFKFR